MNSSYIFWIISYNYVVLLLIHIINNNFSSFSSFFHSINQNLMLIFIIVILYLFLLLKLKLKLKKKGKFINWFD